jgi:flagellar protein FliO/FliZ
MKTLLDAASARTKMWMVVGLLLGLAALVPLGGLSAASSARGLLGALALVGLGGWLMRRGRAKSRFPLSEPMRVVSRTGLSPRCGLALVEVEKGRYLVAYGDSYAEIRRVHAPVRVKTRARRSAVALSREKETGS